MEQHFCFNMQIHLIKFKLANGEKFYQIFLAQGDKEAFPTFFYF
jgi:hypothetical protein